MSSDDSDVHNTIILPATSIIFHNSTSSQAQWMPVNANAILNHATFGDINVKDPPSSMSTQYIN